MSVQNVSFKGHIAYTKHGNVYEKKNTWKRTGTFIGLLGGGASCFVSMNEVLKNTAHMTGTTRKAAVTGIMLAIGFGVTLIMRGLGTLADNYINKKRGIKADETVNAHISKIVEQKLAEAKAAQTSANTSVNTAK